MSDNQPPAIDPVGTYIVAPVLGVTVILAVVAGIYVLGAGIYHFTPLPVATDSTRAADNVFLTGLQYVIGTFALITAGVVIREEVFSEDPNTD